MNEKKINPIIVLIIPKNVSFELRRFNIIAFNMKVWSILITNYVSQFVSMYFA